MESEKEKYWNNTTFIQADTLKVYTEWLGINAVWYTNMKRYKDKIKNRKKRKFTEKQKRK